MNQEIEIELKNLVTKEEFGRLCTSFDMNEADFVEQINYYFDTPDFRLMERQSALRIRHKQNQYTFTLKQPHPSGLLETHEPLDEQTAKQFISGCMNGTSDMIDLLRSDVGVEASALQCLGSLSTSRAEVGYRSGLLVFDHSVYLGHEDFEIEFEVSDEEQGKSEFTQLLREFQIPIRHTPNKIQRFFTLKQQHGT